MPPAANSEAAAAWPADGPHVDAYMAAMKDLLEEMRAWRDAADAANPRARNDAVHAWIDQHGPLFGGNQRAEWRVPVTCYASLQPPPPSWLIEGCRQNLDPSFSVPVANPQSLTTSTLDSLLTLPEEVLIPFDQAGLARAREARQVVPRTYPPDDWSSASLVQPGLLLLPDDGNGPPEALTALLSRARGTAPARTWLDAAKRLLAGPQGPAATAAARRWLARLDGAGATPSLTLHQLATDLAQYIAHIGQGIAAHGSVRDAAIAELCGSCNIYTYFTGPGPFSHPTDHPAILSDVNEAALRGCTWLLSCGSEAGGEAENVAALRRAALACLVKAPSVRGMAYRSLKAVNSCIWALGQIATPGAVAALGKIGMRIQDERLAKQHARAMSEAAARAGLTIADLQEIAVPSHELDAAGERRIGLADGCAATLAVASSTRVQVSVQRGDGKPVKTLPASVRADAESAAAVKALHGSAKELEAALPVHRLRLERGWMSGRRWTGAVFRERMLGHDVMAWFAARLIWTVTPAAGEARTCLFGGNGAAIGADGREQPSLRDDDTVALWHPLDATAPAVAQEWRDMLERHGVVQPIKQAHRETYPLTDAERATDTYSNRFAGHFIRQAQANSLARLRGWSCRSRLFFDVPNDEPTHLRIPAFGLAAEYWTEAAGEDPPEVTEAGAYVFLKTDRVRFRRLHDGGDWQRDGGSGLVLGAEAVSLAAVPPVVFSEVMRDVDLLVGVASIGHDPAWIDAGPAAQHPDRWRRTADAYWQAFNTAELSQSGQTRRAFLANLLPKLAIAAHLHLEERHLAVQGKLNRYRIHLGSGNISIEPDGRYLCIVPSQRRDAQAGIALPFEGDRLLSVILSKAVMLANDTAITDPAITSQLRR